MQLLLAGLLLITSAKSVPLLPPYITPCSKSDPNLKDCYVSHGNEALPSLIRGDKKLRLPNLLPLKFPRVDATAGPNLKLSLIDVSIYGFDTAKLINMETDFDRQKMSIRVTVENSTIVGNYDMDGKIMVLPVMGKGRFKITIKNFELKYYVSYKLEKKQGVNYAKLQRDDTLEWKIEKAHFRFDNLFNGNKQMSDTVNNFINENDQDVLNELGSGITDLVKLIAYKVGESVLGNIPFDDLFVP
ncbi:protein takeout-like [Euwallacea fornicatus]|uniref:protein takeout-like n=1 Tax=Euwallacea fornicatus TaxID=995702 RepID=UPI00338ED7AE